MINYSQSTEQDIILNYFANRVGSGVFLDCGSNDGITLSNTYALATEKFWAGVCVEPAPKAFNKLQELYSEREDIICVNAAISNYTGKSKFWDSGSHVSDSDSSLLSSLNKEETKRWGNTAQFEEIEVNVITFEQLLRLSPYSKFNLISIDCESQDYIIAEQIDLNKLRVEMIIVEYNGKDADKFHSLILPQGYMFHAKNAENLFYVKNK